MSHREVCHAQSSSCHARWAGRPGSVSAAASFDALAQGKPLVKIRYNEVVRSILYAPAYVAMSKGYFKEAGLDVTMTTANGGDKSMAALLSNSADIALIGPETAIYVLNSDSPTKIRIFCGLTTTDGFMLMGREKVDKFDWNMLKGKDILGFRPGQHAAAVSRSGDAQNGIDPLKDVKLNNNVAIPARVGSWLAGQNQYAIFIEPDAVAARARRQGAFPRLDRRDRRPCRLHRRSWRPTSTSTRIPRSSRAGPTRSARRRNGPLRRRPPRSWPGARAVLPGRQQAGAHRPRSSATSKLKIWKTTPVIEPKGRSRSSRTSWCRATCSKQRKRVKFQDLIRTEFANKAK